MIIIDIRFVSRKITSLKASPILAFPYIIKTDRSSLGFLMLRLVMVLWNDSISYLFICVFIYLITISLLSFQVVSVTLISTSAWWRHRAVTEPRVRTPTAPTCVAVPAVTREDTANSTQTTATQVCQKHFFFFPNHLTNLLIHLHQNTFVDHFLSKAFNGICLKAEWYS